MTWGRWCGAKGHAMSALWLSPLVAFVSGQATDPCIFKLLVSPFGRERSPVLSKLRCVPSHGAMHVEQRTISVENDGVEALRGHSTLRVRVRVRHSRAVQFTRRCVQERASRRSAMTPATHNRCRGWLRSSGPTPP